MAAVGLAVEVAARAAWAVAFVEALRALEASMAQPRRRAAWAVMAWEVAARAAARAAATWEAAVTA